jgi:UBX domain-containing protein 1/4
MKKIADANRREKLETQLAKQRAIEQIEADKRARRERAAAEKNGGTIADIPAAKPQHVVAPQPARQYDECHLQVRLADGSNVRQTFKAADLFEKVTEWIRSIQQSVPFILVQNYPKKEFNDNDKYKTLTDLGTDRCLFFICKLFVFISFVGLVPSGSLMVKTLAHFQT